MLKWITAFLAAFFFSSVASAATIGDTVTCWGSYLTCSSNTAVVDGNPEFTIGNLLNADFSLGSLRLSNITSRDVRIASCCAVRFTNQTNPFTGVTVSGSSGLINNSWSGTGLRNGELYIALDGLTFNPGGALSFALTQAQLPAVPEPSIWAMMIVGFGLIGAALRHRRLEGTAPSAVR